MSIQEKFDLAKKNLENKGKDGYKTSDDRIYNVYYSNDDWNDFLKKMGKEDNDAYKAYEKGGGQELKEKLYKGKMLPPKMASCASSSHFVYTLFREKLKNTKVVFEQKLPTSIPRSTSNMDAVLIHSNSIFFIEAKCHEIYASPSPKYKKAFEDFYNQIEKAGIEFSYGQNIAKNDSKLYHDTGLENDTAIKFSYNQEIIDRFDMKQTIAHILGIANACKKGVTMANGKKIHIDKLENLVFVYLIYNPKELKPSDDCSTSDLAKINEMYEKEVKFIKKLNDDNFFNNLFRLSLEYIEYEGDIDSLNNRFKVEYADQNTIKDKIAE